MTSGKNANLTPVRSAKQLSTTVLEEAFDVGIYFFQNPKKISGYFSKYLKNSKF